MKVRESLIGLEKMTKVGSFIFDVITRKYQHCDEPQFYQYSTSVRNQKSKISSTGSGFSFISEKVAKIKCISEAFERKACEDFNLKDLIRSPYKNLSPENTLNPQIFIPFSADQLKVKRNSKLFIKETDIFYWGKVINLADKKEYLIPAQLIYTKFIDKNEKIIRFPISTGAAANFSLDSALYNGICEIVERDSFMIMYLNKVCRSRINLRLIKDGRIQKILLKAKRYLLDVYMFDITTNLNIPSFLCVVIDNSGYGLSVSTGLKSDLDPVVAMLGSLQEAFHTRSWIRSCVEIGDINPEIKANETSSIKDRGAFWFKVNQIKNLNFLLNLPEKRYVFDKKIPVDDLSKLSIAANTIYKQDMHIYYKDLTAKELKGFNYYVVKVIIPELQPLYLNDRYPYLGNKRIYTVPVELDLLKRPHNVSELNMYPHPFL